MLFDECKDRIFNVVQTAREEVPFYRELYRDVAASFDDFTYEYFSRNIPMIDKEYIVTSDRSICSDRYPKDDVFTEYTSGSTGTPFPCHKDRRTKIKLAGYLYDLRKKYSQHLTIDSRYASFYGVKTIDGKKVSGEIFIKNNVLYIPVLDLSKETLKKSWNAICDFKPCWWIGTASAIYAMACEASKGNWPEHEFAFIELNGELVTKEKYDYIRRVFRCPVTNHYGSREFWGIAYSCPANHLHVIQKSVFVESVYDAALDENVLVVTALSNRTSPLIRYRIGDVGTVLASGDCEFYGSKYIVDVSKGRTSHYFNFAGKKVNLFLFSLVLKKLVDERGRNKVKRYQVVKIDERRLTLRIIPFPGVTFGEEDKRYLTDEISNLGKINPIIAFELVDAIDSVGENGKIPEFIDESKGLKGGTG